MMKFRTPYTEMKTVFANPGERIKVVYDLKISKEGKKRIEKVGTTDLQAAIDCELPSVDLYMVLARLANGDEDALMRAEAFYADVTELPVSIREIMEMNDNARKIFLDMPEEYRRLFGNDYMQFLYEPEKLVDEINRKKNENVVEEVIENDNKEQQ